MTTEPSVRIAAKAPAREACVSILHRESILFGLYCEEPVAENACTTDNMASNYTARTLADLFSNVVLHVIDAGEPRTCPAFC